MSLIKHHESGSYYGFGNEMLIRACISVKGTVQGVGFRPFVYRLATEQSLSGYVLNEGGSVEIEVVGEKSEIDRFMKRLTDEAPAVARITATDMTYENAAPGGNHTSFEIKESKTGSEFVAEVPPDLATCKECLRELFDASDRRFLYPFLNCTNCGPRFTVINGLPYDRLQTSMACFPMCDLCQSEYLNPQDRRFHAQPNACHKCGPSLAFCVSEPEIVSFNGDNASAIEKTLESLSQGAIVAIKGLGGFHLVCDATDSGAVLKLRKRKEREAKPFAVMMHDEAQVRKYCHVSSEEQNLLDGPYRPIVLLRKREQMDSNPTTVRSLSAAVAPGVRTLGVMLPYTPLHHILLRRFSRPLIMTSANLSDEPIVVGNREALERLRKIADAFLLHNRDITSRYDDTVTQVSTSGESIIRRARGYAPRPLELRFSAERPILAVGGHLKNSFCLIQQNKAYVSQHIGDLDMLDTVEHFQQTLKRYLSLFRLKPELIACDMHPDYGSTRLVDDWRQNRQACPFPIDATVEVVPVQHHFAHIVSCMAEHGIDEAVIGVAFDGIGFGADGKLWGGEFLVCTPGGFQRRAKFADVRMPGGTMAIKEPWRMAISYLHQANRTRATDLKRYTGRFDERIVRTILNLADSDSSPSTSSCGRLFDGVASLLGLCDFAKYEGHAAVLLEYAAESIPRDRFIEPYPVIVGAVDVNDSRLLEVDQNSIISGVLGDLKGGRAVEWIAARFHETMARLILAICLKLREEDGLNKVCLSGGVFQNQRLTSRVTSLLVESNFVPYRNHLVPANDGGISLGQAIAALEQRGLLTRDAT